MFYAFKNILIILGFIFIVGCGGSSNNDSDKKQKKGYNVSIGITQQVYDVACNGKTSELPWHISKLFNCNNNTFYIPYELWSGAVFDGNKKESDKCFHSANTKFKVNKTSSTTIKDIGTWESDHFKTTFQVWERKKESETKTQYFTCHAEGIGRVYDHRDNRKDRYYTGTGAKFPAGYGWKINVLKSSTNEEYKDNKLSTVNKAIKILNINFNDNNELASIRYAWWYKNTLDHIYLYKPNESSNIAFKIAKEVDKNEDLTSYIQSFDTYMKSL